LAHGFVNKSRVLIESEAFQWLFSDIVQPSKRDWGKSFYANTAKGSRLAMTTAGGTGKDADLLICDDPMQASKAYSAAERERAWRWYTGTFKMRGTSQQAGEILVMQRLHEDDVVGRILANPKLRKLYDVLCFPAEYESVHPVPTVSSIGFKDPRSVDGELLWESRFATDWVEERNDALGKQVASAQLQQRPAPSDGLVFADEMFPSAEESETSIMAQADRVVLSIDCTFKDSASGDFVAMLVFARAKGQWYCVGGINERLDFVATLEAIKELTAKYRPSEYLIEDKANGSAVMRLMRDAFENVIPIVPRESKLARASAASSLLMRGNVLFLKNKPVVDALIDQCLSFPMGRHDDLVDALTQFVNKTLNIRQDVPSLNFFGV